MQIQEDNVGIECLSETESLTACGGGARYFYVLLFVQFGFQAFEGGFVIFHEQHLYFALAYLLRLSDGFLFHGIKEPIIAAATGANKLSGIHLADVGHRQFVCLLGGYQAGG